MQRTPTSVIVLSIIGIIWSVLVLLSLLWSIAAWFIHFGPPNPALETLKTDPVYITVTVISTILNIAITSLLLVASIGSLRLRTGARRTMIIYAWLEIGKLILSTILSVTYIMPKMNAVMAAAIPPGSPGASPGMIHTMMTISMIGGVCFAVVFLAYPICLLYFFSRPHVIDAFNGIFPPGQGAFPVITPTDSTTPLPPH